MNQSPDQKLLTSTRIIWGAFLAAPFIYLLMSWIVTSQNEPGPWQMPLTAALVLMALGGVVVGQVVPDRTVDQEIAKGSRSLTAPAIYQTAMIVRWAAYESVAVIGFVLSFTCYRFLPTVVGAVIAIGLVASAAPSQTGVAAVQEKLDRIRS